MKSSPPSTSHSETSLTYSEIVLLHGDRFASRKRPLGILLFCVILFGVSGLTIWRGWADSREAQRAKSWPTVTGVILSSDIRDEGDTYAPDIHYQYIVDDQVYEGTQIFIGSEDSSSDLRSAQNVAGSFPKGAKVSVSYDPGDVTNAVLQTGVSFSTLFPLLIGMVFLLLACFVFWTQSHLIFQR